jgi:TonB family protein
MKTRATRWRRLYRGLGAAIALCSSIVATHPAAAQNAPAGTSAPNNVAPPVAAPNEAAAAELADWRKQMVDRIASNTVFPVRGQCQEGVVKISFLIDRAGNLVASEIAESSNIPAFDAEALAIIKRGHPFPPPPESVGGTRVTLTVPVRFKQPSQDASGERRVYLNLKADLTLTLNGTSVQRAGLDRAISSTTNNDKKVQIMICSDENVRPEELNGLVEQVKGAGYKFTVVPRPDATSE